ncbi:hypothetical protein N0V83_008267 [Neocucurbitaria cava]|uniref:RNA-dependent RNA polymerase n=1 Tax=Neocucurbitaria cava TaxID=798079 RepID=A0A9W9CJH5_9PLEO|nr:hypothetical protein N0V83_008267 [Neocucurbitaria cava]
MDIFIQNVSHCHLGEKVEALSATKLRDDLNSMLTIPTQVPQNANHVELQLFLKDKLNQLDILAYDVYKFRAQNGRHFAILTVASVIQGNSFLQYYGSRGRQAPLKPLFFRGERLRFQRSNRPGQPEPLKIRTLQEKEETMRAKMKGQTPSAQIPRAHHSLPFQTLMTGVWDYNNQSKLFFDQKFKDMRQGYITFGSAALVIYLQEFAHRDFDWHCRIDIPYAILEHVLPSFGNGQRQGTITFTLKSPPKFYHIQSTEDLHLYAGKEAPPNDLPNDMLSALASLNLGPSKKAHRLERLCALSQSDTKNSALCMVYRIAFFDTRSAKYAWNYVKDFAIPEAHDWKTTESAAHLTNPIEVECYDVERILSDYRPSIPFEFDFQVRFQLMALMLEGTITPRKMIRMIPFVQKIARKHGSELTANGIRQLGRQIPTPAPNIDADQFSLDTLQASLFRGVQESQERRMIGQDLNSKHKKHQHLVLTYRSTVTPTGILLRGPDWGVSNRVLRKYSNHSEYFMRVFFADEDGLSVFHDPRASHEQVYARFRHVLQNGITVAGRTFDFLGFSHASLRNHQAWFLAPFEQEDGVIVCASDIIRDLGDFSHIHCSAKCAARIGQAFSDTIFSVTIPSTAYIIEVKNDVMRNGRCFSDGCGTISYSLLRQVWRALPPERRQQRPTVLQIRYRGAKGVLSLDSSLGGEQLHIRKSMTKYVAKESWKDLELCGAAYKPLSVYLNHQFIRILEDLGVPVSSFKSVQDEAVRTLKLITEHPLSAASFLQFSGSAVFAKIPTLFELMNQIGLSFHADQFLTDVVEVAAMAWLRSIKYRARIPIADGHLLYGIMDETNTLQEGEVYIPTQAFSDGKLDRSILVGTRIMVTRAPALHPGDVQLVTAVDVAEDSPLRSLYNCIVFSQQGARDLPSQLSGGDLDGDLFHVIYDRRLIPNITVPPADYASTPAKDLGRPVQVNDIVDFFVEYMNMDRLGQISNKHKIRADKHPSGTQHPECIVLAGLASDAVDFSKSGVPADMKKIPPGHDQIRPDFMAPGSNFVINKLGAAELEELEQDDADEPDVISILDADKFKPRYYRSDNVLGILYRDIDEKKFFDRMKHDFEMFRRTWGGESLVQKLSRYVDRETSGILWDHHQDFAEELREYYEDNMLEIMDTLRPHRGQPLTELEVFSGNILGKKERAPSRYIREANLEVQERFNRDVSGIIKRIIHGDGEWESARDAEALPRAIACFKVALEGKGWENYRTLKSWRYVTAAVCLEQLWQYQGRHLRPL